MAEQAPCFLVCASFRDVTHGTSFQKSFLSFYSARYEAFFHVSGQKLSPNLSVPVHVCNKTTAAQILPCNFRCVQGEGVLPLVRVRGACCRRLSLGFPRKPRAWLCSVIQHSKEAGSRLRTGFLQRHSVAGSSLGGCHITCI